MHFRGSLNQNLAPLPPSLSTWMELSINSISLLEIAPLLSPIASDALMIRFITTCRICAGLA